MKRVRTASKVFILAKLDEGWRICSRRRYAFGRQCWSNALYPLDLSVTWECYVPRTSVLRALHAAAEIEVCGSMNGHGDAAGTVDRYYRRAQHPGDLAAQALIEGAILDSFTEDEATVRHREARAAIMQENRATDERIAAAAAATATRRMINEHLAALP